MSKNKEETPRRRNANRKEQIYNEEQARDIMNQGNIEANYRMK
jgi:hypothetical protein